LKIVKASNKGDATDQHGKRKKTACWKTRQREKSERNVRSRQAEKFGQHQDEHEKAHASKRTKLVIKVTKPASKLGLSTFGPEDRKEPERKSQGVRKSRTEKKGSVLRPKKQETDRHNLGKPSVRETEGKGKKKKTKPLHRGA